MLGVMLVDVAAKHPSGAPAGLTGQVTAVLAQLRTGGQRDQALGLPPVVADRRDGENEPALTQPDGLDHDRSAGPRQLDHVTGVDICSKHQILHE